MMDPPISRSSLFEHRVTSMEVSMTKCTRQKCAAMAKVELFWDDVCFIYRLQLVLISYWLIWNIWVKHTDPRTRLKYGVQGRWLGLLIVCAEIKCEALPWRWVLLGLGWHPPRCWEMPDFLAVIWSSDQTGSGYHLWKNNHKYILLLCNRKE